MTVRCHGLGCGLGQGIFGQTVRVHHLDNGLNGDISQFHARALMNFTASVSSGILTVNNLEGTTG